MDTDDHIKQALQIGEKNQKTMTLIRNWCRHARVELVGGVSIVEQQTGLPIGQRAMACEYAAARGLGMFDLADGAVDFYDRNCASCTQRVPVGVPNIGTLVERRDAARREELAKEAARLRSAEERLEARRQVRVALRGQLGPLSAPLIDAIEDLEQDRRSPFAAALLETANLAPETFTPPVIDYYFSLLEAQEAWFFDLGLEVLARLGADPSRLARCALMALSRHWGVEPAGRIVEASPNLLDDALIERALPALAGLANPPHMPMAPRDPPVKGPLLAAYAARPAAVEAALTRLLDQREPFTVGAAARAVYTLYRDSGLRASNYARSLGAKLARAEHLLDIDERSYTDKEVITELQTALAVAIEDEPTTTDALLAGYISGASTKGEVRVYEAYGRVIKRSRGEENWPLKNQAAHIVIDRLLQAAATSNSYDVLSEIQSALSYVSEDVYPILKDKLTSILGSVLIIGDRLVAIDAELDTAANANIFDRLQKEQFRSVLEAIQKRLLEGVASAASGDGAATGQYVEVLKGIPESRDKTAGKFIEHSAALMHTPQGLNALLPVLYTSLVGVSFHRRRAAAHVIGELDYRRRDDLPLLVYEAFMPLLSDPKIGIHKTAVHVLRKLTLPPELKQATLRPMALLIQVYGQSQDDDDFLLKLIRIYRDESRDLDEANRRRNDEIFFALIEKRRDRSLLQELGWLASSFSQAPHFPALITRLFRSSELHPHQHEALIDALNAIPEESLYGLRSELEAIAASTTCARDLSASVVETLTRVGAWGEAARVNDAIYQRIPSSVELLPHKLSMNLERIATLYEEAIAAGKLEALPALAADWRETESLIDKDRKENEQRRSYFPRIPDAN